jgi:hypothetical protein
MNLGQRNPVSSSDLRTLESKGRYGVASYRFLLTDSAV